MSDRSIPPPDEQGVILFGNIFGNVSLNDLLNGVVLDEVDLDSLLSTAHKVEVEENSQTLKEDPVDSVPIVIIDKDEDDYDDIDGDFDDDDEDSENNQEGVEAEKSEESVEAEKTEEGVAVEKAVK